MAAAVDDDEAAEAWVVASSSSSSSSSSSVAVMAALLRWLRVRCLARVVARPVEADEEEEEDVTAVEVEDDGGWLMTAVSMSAAISLAFRLRKKTCASASFPVKGLSPAGFSVSRPITYRRVGVLQCKRERVCE